MQMVMTSHETQIQMSADWPVLRKTRDKEKQEKSRISCRDKETADRQNCPAEKSWPNQVKTEWAAYRI